MSCDDWIDANYIEKLYDDISESGADVAVPAFCISFENGDCAVDSRVKEVTTYSKKEALEVFLFNGYLTPCVASKMWKKSLWQKIRCPEGKLFEDQYTTYKLLMLANKIVFDPEVYYYYFKRSGSIGHSSFSKRTYDLLFGIGEQYQVITEAFKECLNDSDDYRLSVLFYFVTGVYFDAYNGLRQYIAVSICFYAMKYILNKDAKRYFLAVLIAFLFHKSALFFVPVYFLQYLKFDFKKAITIVGLTVLSGSGLFAILKFIIKYTPYAFYFTLNSVELNEIVASQSSILFFGVSTIIGYYYYSKEKEIDTKTQLLYNMQIISLSIALMTAFVPLINRVLYYGMAYELLYLPNMLKLINNRREKMLVKVFLILMYGGITAYGMINSGWYTCIPYNFYFDYR